MSLEENLGARRVRCAGEPAVAKRIVMIGEDNPQSADPEHALYPYPPGCPGHRLLEITGLKQEDYLAIWRTNLCSPTWSLPAARARAREILWSDAPWTNIVMLGSKVAQVANKVLEAHLAEPIAPMTWRRVKIEERVLVVVSLPHPSGMNRFWNLRSAASSARALLREAIPQYPWGEL